MSMGIAQEICNKVMSEVQGIKDRLLCLLMKKGYTKLP